MSRYNLAGRPAAAAQNDGIDAKGGGDVDDGVGRGIADAVELIDLQATRLGFQAGEEGFGFRVVPPVAAHIDADGDFADI